MKEADITADKINKVRLLNELAVARNQTLAQLALAWLMKDKRITTVLIGASKPEQVLNSIACLENLHFSTEELNKINSILG